MEIEHGEHGPQNKFSSVTLQTLSHYSVLLSTVKHGDNPSGCGRVRENVGLSRCRVAEVSLHTPHMQTENRTRKEFDKM